MIKQVSIVCLSAAMSLSALADQHYSAEKSKSVKPASDSSAPKITLANGEKNWIKVDGLSRDGKIFTVPEVHIDGNGWLVMHPFEGGKPNGDKYVAASYVKSGTNKDVQITVHKGVESGEKFIVMLHRDLNENKVLDFVFVSDTGVMDEAVFESSTMVAHVIAAP